MTLPGKDAFQSTRPCGARRAIPKSRDPLIPSFNPRAPAGRDSLTRAAAAGSFNPRAPAGRDPQPGQGATARAVSIHAPLRGATGRRQRGEQILGLFQSTRPCGARPDQQRQGGHDRRVSIHAPLRGATSSGSACISMYSFQSTRPCGARRSAARSRHRTRTRFNPRAPAGRDADRR